MYRKVTIRHSYVVHVQYTSGKVAMDRPSFITFLMRAAAIYSLLTRLHIPVCYENEKISMQHHQFNEQAMLAEQFILTNILTNQASYEAVLSIKRWKLIKRIQSRDKSQYYETVSLSLAFLTGITNFLLLQQVGFFFTEHRN